MAVHEEYEPVIGLEVHAQLSTESKIFCGCRVAYGEPPNSLTCPVCLGLPGALPVLNRRAVEFAMRMILATGGSVQARSVFARKNYFYPDLPKGFQISQYDRPVGEGGAVSFHLESGEEEVCRLSRIHLEEDAGKMIHPEHGEKLTRVDLNRCGTPLVEIVSEPDIKSPESAYSYLNKVKQILQYLEICSGDMEKGHLRCDANVSVRPTGCEKPGTRTEVKNMNSFKAVERSLRFEIDRQTQLLKNGETVKQTTLLWNEDSQTAEVMRGKEQSEDYRYFPEPDLVELNVTDRWVEKVRQTLPELPDAKATRFVSQYGIRRYDADILIGDRPLADYYENVVRHFEDARTAANWILTDLLGILIDRGEDITACRVEPGQMAELLSRVKAGEISSRIGKVVLAEMAATGHHPDEIIERKALAQISDEAVLQPVVDKILADNPQNVSRYKEGREALLDFFIGQVMKATGGRANPTMVNRLLKERLKG